MLPLCGKNQSFPPWAGPSYQQIPKLENTQWSEGGQADWQVMSLHQGPSPGPAPSTRCDPGQVALSQGLYFHLAKVALMIGFAELTHVTALWEP